MASRSWLAFTIVVQIFMTWVLTASWFIDRSPSRSCVDRVFAQQHCRRALKICFPPAASTASHLSRSAAHISPVVQFDMMCENEDRLHSLRRAIGTSLGVGALFGGYLADLFGRRRIQIVALVVVAIAGVCATASQTLNSYVVARCVATGSAGMVSVIGCTMAWEYSEKQNRLWWQSMLVGVGVGGALLVIPQLSTYQCGLVSGPWQHTLFATTVTPTLLLLLSMLLQAALSGTKRLAVVLGLCDSGIDPESGIYSCCYPNEAENWEVGTGQLKKMPLSPGLPLAYLSPSRASAATAQGQGQSEKVEGYDDDEREHNDGEVQWGDIEQEDKSEEETVARLQTQQHHPHPHLQQPKAKAANSWNNSDATCRDLARRAIQNARLCARAPPLRVLPSAFTRPTAKRLLWLCCPQRFRVHTQEPHEDFEREAFGSEGEGGGRSQTMVAPVAPPLCAWITLCALSMGAGAVAWSSCAILASLLGHSGQSSQVPV
jgi:hypothetical protein